MSKFKPAISQPLVHVDQWAILDYQALLKHTHNMGQDPDCVYGSVTGKEINSAQHTVRAFLDAYILPILDNGFTPRQILVAHDDGHAYRSKLLPAYKEKRDQRKNDETVTDPEIFQELNKASDSIKRILAYLGCTQARVKGVEGDDIIAHFCKLPGLKQVYTVDADLLRLTAEDTMVILKNKPIFLQDLDVENLPKNMHKFIEPFMKGDNCKVKNPFKYLTLYKSIVGDSSDEYKGVPQMGDKAWADLVETFDFDGLDELISIVEDKDWKKLDSYVKHYEETANGSKAHKLLKKLHDEAGPWRTCWTVAELHPELCYKPFNKKLTQIDWFKRVPNRARIVKLLEDNYCPEFLEDLEQFLPVEWLIDASNFEESDIDEFREICEQSPHISFDYEGATDNQDWINTLLNSTSMKSYVDVLGQGVTGVSFNFGNNLQYTCYLTIDHKNSHNLPIKVVRKFFEAIPKDKIRVAHNSQFEEVLTFTNLDGYVMPIGTVHDTAIMSTYDDENKESHGLKALSKTLLGYNQASYEDTLAQAGATNMRELTACQVLKYGLDDSTVTGHLYDLFRISLYLQDMMDFYVSNEPYVNHRLAMSFIQGTDIDWERQKEIQEEDERDIEESMSELREILEEHCSNVNREAAEAFFNEEKKFLEASARDKYGKMDRAKVISRADAVASEIEKMDIADDTYMDIANSIRAKVPQAKSKKDKEAREEEIKNLDHKVLIAWIVKFDLHKALNKNIEDSVYVKYVKTVHSAEFAPSVKNLDTVAEKLGLPLPGTAAKGKLEAWEASVREIDFEAEIDKYDEFNDDQKKFIDLLAKARNHFKPDQRGHEDYQAFQSFCCNLLGIEGKVSYSGTELNLGSPNQMKGLLYCMLGLPVRLRGKPSPGRTSLGFWEGSPATDALAQDTALAEDITVNPERHWQERVINLIKKVTECNTRMSLYHNSYPYLAHPRDGKLHPNVRNCGTVTRRPTGSQPNILQVSKHQKKGAMRGIYIPPRGYCVVPIDFAGQELRIQASETKDKNLLQVYLGEELAGQYLRGEVLDITYDMVKDKKDLKDLHSMTASGITEHFGLDEAGKLVPGGQHIKWTPPTYEEYVEAHKNEDHEYHDLASKVRKRPAKQTNFLLSYGGTSQTLSHRLIIPESVAQSIMDSTLTLYAGIPVAQDETLHYARMNGFVTTAYGNRRHATDEIFSKSKGPVNRQVRQLYNYRIQGCAADILKVVLANCEKQDLWDKYNAIMVAPVYDEVVAYVPFEHAWDFVQDMRSIMNLTPPGHAVPMVADVSVGPNWQVQYELGHQPTKEEFDKCMNENVIPEAEAIWDRIEAA
ncbi:hypothetical protein SHOU24_38 [Vibrio phage SHOU24]|uniref:hypothetical protein n=1 Tax=Vibrio phage SHOU24 TaxID=1414739 RepID=UPI0003ED20D2|nr:hypothetical protein SHOU24_38 [Vibrio phage SHOU24]AHI61235.1 hypothetical protein SHOU24_38 [Vibrio phage SHOU24]